MTEELKTKRIGFLGMGSMGFPICCGLVRNGYSVMLPMWRHKSSLEHGYSPLAPNKEKKEEMYRWMLSQGAVQVFSQKEMLKNSEILILSLPSSKQVENIIEGQDGVLQLCRKGTIIVDLTSADYQSTKRLSAKLQQAGMHILDAPVSGGPKGASEQTLTVMVGGNRGIYERMLPILTTIGSAEKVNYIGESGSGDLLKCCNNYLTATALVASTQALAVCAKGGIDPEQAARIISESSGSNNAVKVKYPQIVFLGGKWNFTLGLMKKDVGLFQSSAQSMEITGTIADEVEKILQNFSQNYGENADLTIIPEMIGKMTETRLYDIDKNSPF